MAAKRTPEQNRAIYLRRKAKAEEQGFGGYRKKRRILHDLPDLLDEGNELTGGNDREPALMSTELNDLVNPKGVKRSGDWRLRLYQVVLELRGDDDGGD